MVKECICETNGAINCCGHKWNRTWSGIRKIVTAWRFDDAEIRRVRPQLLMVHLHRAYAIYRIVPNGHECHRCDQSWNGTIDSLLCHMYPYAPSCSSVLRAQLYKYRRRKLYNRSPVESVTVFSILVNRQSHLFNYNIYVIIIYNAQRVSENAS